MNLFLLPSLKSKQRDRTDFWNKKLFLHKLRKLFRQMEVNLSK
jgi:hypothetical protein